MAKTMPRQQPGRSQQDVRTPRELLAAVRALLDIDAFVVDLAATRANTVARKFYGLRANSLLQPWTFDGFGWCNPPFSDLAPWVQKGHEERAKGAQTAMLVPAAVGANWWRDHVHGKAHVLLLNGRVMFVGHAQGYPKDCAVLIYAAGWTPGYRVWSWASPVVDTSDAERALRDVHVARLKGEQEPSRHLLHFDEVTMRVMADGILTPTAQMKAREYVALLDAHTLQEKDETEAISA